MLRHSIRLIASILWVFSATCVAQDIQIRDGQVYIEKKPCFRIEQIKGDGGRLYADFSIQNLQHQELIYFRCDTSVKCSETGLSAAYQVIFNASGRQALVTIGQTRVPYQIVKLIIRSNLIVDGSSVPFAEKEFCKAFPMARPSSFEQSYVIERRNKRFAIKIKDDGTIEQQKTIGSYQFGYEIDDDGDDNTIEFYLPNGQAIAKVRRQRSDPFLFTIYTLKDRKVHQQSLSVRYLEELVKFLVDNFYL